MRRGAWAFALLLLVLLASGALTARRLGYLPVPADLDRAAAAVREAFRAGDLILATPPWLDGAQQRLGDLAFWAPRRLAPDDLRGVGRVHLVELPTLGDAPDLAPALAARGRPLGSAWFGGVRVTTWELAGRERLLFDLREGLAAVEVRARYADGVELPCDNYQRDRWVCPRDPGWSYVGPETLEIDGQPRDCVWLHPLPGGASLRLRLPRLAAPAKGELDAAFGFTADAARRAAAPVQVRLEQGGETLATATIPVAPGWRRLRGALRRSPEPVELVLETANNGAAHLCGQLRVYEVSE